MLITASENGLKVNHSTSAQCEAFELPPKLWPTIVGLEKLGHPSVRNGAGPLSLKFVNRGIETFEINGQRKVVDPNSFLLVNYQQDYSSAIDDTSTETVSIFFNQDFVIESVNSMLSRHGLLEELNPGTFGHPEFFQSLHAMNQYVHRICSDMTEGLRKAFDDINYYRELFQLLLEQVLLLHEKIIEQIRRLPVVKRATRIELFRRISIGRDFIESNFRDDINLEFAAQEAYMSKYHFLRFFKLITGYTPYQYLLNKRMRAAHELLQTSDLSISEIALQTGYNTQNSFTHAFRNFWNFSPSSRR